MTGHDKENSSSIPSIQVHEVLQKSNQLPTPMSSRDSSRVGARQDSAHVEQPQQPSSVAEPPHVDQTLQPYRRVQTPQAQRVEQQPPPVKRKRGRPRKRPLSPSSEYPHVKVRVVPTTAQSEYMRQRSQAQRQAGTVPTSSVALPMWQNAQAASDSNATDVSGMLQAPTINSSTLGAPTTFHAADAQYPPDVSSIWSANQPSDHYPPVIGPIPEWSGLTAQQAVLPALTESSQFQHGAWTTSRMFDNSTNDQRSQTTNAATTTLKNAADHAAAPGEIGHKRRPRPSLKVRENSTQVEEESTNVPRQNQDITNNINNAAALTKSMPKAKASITKSPRAKDKRKGEAGAKSNDATTIQKHLGMLPAENSFITDRSLLRHDNVDAQPRLRSESLKSNSQALSQPPHPAQTQSLHQPPGTKPLPWHVTRWHELGFITFETGNTDPDTGEKEYRVVLRSGKLDNTLAFWYEHAMGGIALKYGPKMGKEQGEVLFNSVSEVAHMMMKAREDIDIPRQASGMANSCLATGDMAAINVPKTARKKSLEQMSWDFLLEDMKREAQAWKHQRRSVWAGLKSVQKEVRARRLSRGDFVAEEDAGEDCGVRSDVAMADGDEDENAVGGEVGLGYHRERPQMGSHWMSWEDVQRVARPGEVLRSRITEVQMWAGSNTKYKMVYCPMQDPRRSNFEKALDCLEQRLEGLRILRKSKLRMVFEQIEAGAYGLKRVVQDQVGGGQVRALAALV